MFGRSKDTRKKRFASRIVLITVGLMLVLSACGAPAATDSISLRLAYFPNLTHTPALIGVAQGTFQKALGATKLETRPFNAGPALIEAMLAGEIDIAYVGPNPAINGYVKSRGDALRIVAGASSGGALFVVRPDANINTAKDLDGKKLATPQKGGTQDVALRHYLQSNGLKSNDDGGTVNVLPTQNPDILTLFQKGEIDGAWVPEPWATRLVQEAKGKVFVDERDLWPAGKFVTTVVIVSSKFLKAHPEVIKAFLAAHVDSIKFVQDKPEDARKLVNTEIERLTGKGLPSSVIDAAFQNIDFVYDPLPQSLFVTADHAFDLGFLGDSKPELKGILDLTVLNQVLKEKGLAEIQSP